MAASVHCPKCASENVVFSKKRGAYVCEDCGNVLPEAPVAPLRIFLSYGHDANEELVRRIKADLEKRSHDVWFDKTEIKFGDEWRRAITDGILQSNRVVSFLSKHSTRDPGVCLDEIAIAIGAKGGNIQTILVESEREVKPPPSISHIQWLDMHDWKERRAAGEAAWEQWYQAKLAEIIAVVEIDESRRFAGEIKTLEDLLKPTASDFAADARIRQLLEKKLVGRTWLFEAVEKWRITAERDARLFWLMGAPGIGKSAFAAHLAHEYGRGTVIAVQFCDWKKPDHRDACRIIRTLAFQIATRLPDYRKLLLTLPIMTELDRKNSAELFDGLLTNPLKLSITGGRERYLIVIDALDEAGGDGRNELVEVLARYAGQLPDWIGLVVTSRPEFDVTTPFQALKPFPFETKSAANSEDIRAYLRRELATQLQNRPDADRLVEQILEKSEGVFLYVESFCEDIRKNHLSLDRPNEFPQGLVGKFYMDFHRYFPDLEQFRKDVRPALRAILAAREPLPVEILQRLFSWQDEELRDFTRPLASIFPVTTESDRKVIKPYHKSLADWMTDEAKAGPYFVSTNEGHRILAEFGLTQVNILRTDLEDFWARHLLTHLERAGKRADLEQLMNDSSFTATRALHSPNWGLPIKRFHAAAWQEIFAPIPSGPCVGILSQSEPFVPLRLKGIIVRPTEPTWIQLITDAGDYVANEEVMSLNRGKLYEYFLTALGTPPEDLRVSLPALIAGKIAATPFQRTSLGRIFAEQDCLFKHRASSLLHPDSETGEKFWKLILPFARSHADVFKDPFHLFFVITISWGGATVFQKEPNQPVPSEFALNYKIRQEDWVAFVIDARSKLEIEMDIETFKSDIDYKTPQAMREGTTKRWDVEEYCLQAIKQHIQPILEHEIENGKQFMAFRQALDVIVLAQWYQKTLAQAGIHKVCLDLGKQKYTELAANIRSGLETESAEWLTKLKAYYERLFIDGSFSCVRSLDQPDQGQQTPRVYFAGAIKFDALPLHIMETIR